MRHLEQRDINVNTNRVWAIQDVPRTWRSKVEKKIIEDDYYFAEDGTVYPRVNEEAEENE